MSKESIYNNAVLCAKCSSPQMTIDTGVYATEGFANLICNDCGFKEVLASKEAAQKIMEKAGFGVSDSFVPKATMQATLCYNSVETVGPMRLKDLYDAVIDAMEKGMPMDSEVFNSDTGKVIEGVRFLYETEKFEPILCGNHIGEDKYDIVVNTHECEE